MLPFRFGYGWSLNTTRIEDDVWTKTDEDIHKLDFLLEHVKEFFSKNYQVGKEDESACIIMKLKKEALPVKMFNNKKYFLSNKSFNNSKKSGKLLRVPVYIDPNSFRIIWHPFTSVAILLYSIELVKSDNNEYQPNLDDFIRMNYLLRLFNRHDEAFFISRNERREERKKLFCFLIMKIRIYSKKPIMRILNCQVGGHAI